MKSYINALWGCSCPVTGIDRVFDTYRKRCSVSECTTLVNKRGLCNAHGAKGTCKHDGCELRARVQGYCESQKCPRHATSSHHNININNAANS